MNVTSQGSGSAVIGWSQAWRLGVRPAAVGLLLGGILGTASLVAAAEDSPRERATRASRRGATLSPPSNVGLPVNVNTGNAWLSQTDAAIPGVGQTLILTREYNSVNAFEGQGGGFGRGWSHGYEQRLTRKTASMLEFQQASGITAYYYDNDGNGTYASGTPQSDRSYVTLVAGGGYQRHFEHGGAETYDAVGRWVSAEDRFGQTTTLEYDGSGLLSEVTEAGGRALSFTWTASRISAVSGPTGPVATYEYDATGTMLAGVTYPDGSGYTFEYDSPWGQLLRAKDRTGRTLETHAYEAGKAVTSEIADGQEGLGFSYGGDHTVVTDAFGNSTVYEYAVIGGALRVWQIYGACTMCGGGVQKTWSFDERGRMIRERDSLGRATSFEYDTRDNLTVRKDTWNRATTYTYDDNNRVTSVTTPDGAVRTTSWVLAGPEQVTYSLSSGETASVSMTYWPSGKLKTVTDPMQRVTTFTYDDHGDLVSVASPTGTTTYTYHSDGRRWTETNEGLNQTTTFTYDPARRLQTVQRSDGATLRYEYDLGGRRTAIVDPAGRKTHTVYDPYGRVQDAIDPAGGRTHFTYDAMSNATSITDAINRTTSFEYDAYRHVTKTTFPNGKVETRSYDDAGRLTTRVDRRGVTTTYAYDPLDRLLSKRYSDATPRVLLAYDAMDRVRRVDNEADVVARAYDLAGRLSSEQSTANGSLIGYTYSVDSSRTTMSLDGALQLTYTADPAGRLASVTAGLDTYALEYDTGARRSLLSYPNGIQTSYDYDAVSRLAGITSRNAANEILASTSYTHDGVLDNRWTKTSLDHGETYSYDVLDRLESVERTGVDAGKALYMYDPIGNRLGVSVDPGAATDGRSHSYDANGNLVSKTAGGDLWTYAWDAENQLTSVTKNGTEVARFSYDGLGRRIAKTAGGVTTRYLYDGIDILRETRSDGLVYSYVHGPGIDEPWARVDQGGARQVYLADGLGSITRVLGPTNQTLLSRRYDAWGNLQAGGEQPGHAFTGREWDPEIGLHYYRARYYDSRIGRFISEDPIGFWGGVNFYAYAANDPANLVDPSGEQCVSLGIDASFMNPVLMGARFGAFDPTVLGGRQLPTHRLGPSQTFNEGLRPARATPPEPFTPRPAPPIERVPTVEQLTKPIEPRVPPSPWQEPAQWIRHRLGPEFMKDFADFLDGLGSFVGGGPAVPQCECGPIV